MLPPDCKELTLDMAEKFALANNPDLTSKQHALEAAWARYYQSFGAYFPQVGTAYSLGYYNVSPTNNSSSGSVTNSAINLNAQWLIFDGLVREMGTLIRKHETNKEKEINENATRILKESVSLAYWDVVLAKNSKEIQDANVAFNEFMITQLTASYDHGASDYPDILNFKIKENYAKNMLLDYETNLEVAKSVLAELMGLTDGILLDDVKFQELKTDKVKPLTFSFDYYADIAISKRPDLKMFREILNISELNVYSKWGGFSPKVYLGGSAGYMNSRGTTPTIFDGQGDVLNNLSWNSNQMVYSAFATAQMDLFDGGKKIFLLREAQALSAESKYQLMKKWISIIAEVHQIYDSYKIQVKKVEYSKDNKKLSTESRNSIEKAYLEGHESLTRLNEAQKDLIISETDYIISIIQYYKYQAKLQSVLGTSDFI